MLEKEGLAAEVIAAIRADSESTKLSPLEELRATHPRPAPGTDPGAVAAGAHSSIEELLAEAEAPDIKLMRGVRETYYFSDLHITEGYAKHLFRIAERDPLRLVADTVRDESRIYPRPTAISVFMEKPFSMPQTEFDTVLVKIMEDPDYSDIAKTTASNGALYLFSTQFLTPAHAESLAEWIEVEQWENP